MHRFQWSAIVFLVLALIFGAGSGLMEGLSHEKPEDSFFYWCGAVAAKLFTIAVVFVVARAIQWQKGRTNERFEKLERELLSLKGPQQSVQA